MLKAPHFRLTNARVQNRVPHVPSELSEALFRTPEIRCEEKPEIKCSQVALKGSSSNPAQK